MMLVTLCYAFIKYIMFCYCPLENLEGKMVAFLLYCDRLAPQLFPQKFCAQFILFNSSLLGTLFYLAVQKW